jgi:hypothetical protein
MLARQIAETFLFFALALGAIPLFAQDRGSTSAIPDGLRVGLDTIKGPTILTHVKNLASDEFEGRAPGTRGEDLTVKYLIEQFKAVGAAPGNPDGTYFQTVPMIGYETVPKIDLVANGRSIPLRFLDDFVHDLPALKPKVAI